MINFHDVNKGNIKKDIPNWPKVPCSSIQNINNSESGKTNSLFNLINKQPDIDKIYLYVRDTYETKTQFSINKRESAGLKHLNDSNVFIEYSNDMDDVYKNIGEYNPNKKRKHIDYF